MSKPIKEIRADKFLDKMCNTPMGFMSRRDWVKAKKDAGAAIETVKIRKYKAEETERTWLANNAWSHPWGNQNHPQTIEYNRRKEALKHGFYKEEYRLAIDGESVFTVISKVEFDYFNSL